MKFSHLTACQVDILLTRLEDRRCNERVLLYPLDFLRLPPIKTDVFDNFLHKNKKERAEPALKFEFDLLH